MQRSLGITLLLQRWGLILKQNVSQTEIYKMIFFSFPDLEVE